MASMASRAPTESAQEAVRRELRKAAYRPIELLKALRNQGYADSDIKQAISQLLHDGVIELTSQRMLKGAAQNGTDNASDSAA